MKKTSFCILEAIEN